ncbi:MAG: nitroreductase family protein [Promethearchaeota archaeon]
MKIININDDKCIKCLKCVNDCPTRLFFKPPTITGKKRIVKFEDPFNSCIICGHCISICPTDAIEYEASDRACEFEETRNPSSIIIYENLLKFLRIRRSIRSYKEDPVPREEINSILEAMRYAPSAGNKQSWEFIVLTEKEKISNLRDIVMNLILSLNKVIRIAKYFRFFLSKNLKEQVNTPRTMISLNSKIERFKNGQDPIFFNAPVVIIIYAPKYGSMTGNDAGITLTYGMLAAQARGLGTCWIGYAQEALRRNKKYRKKLGIPKKMNVHGVLILGYPAVEYHRVPPRNPLKIKWN